MIEITSKQEALKKLAQKYNLRLLLLFGSQVTGKVHKESDYDIAYLGSKTFSFEKESEMHNDLLAIIGPEDERLLSLTNIQKAPPLLLKNIFDKNKKLFVRNPSDYDKYYIYSIKKMADSRPLFDLMEYQIGRYFEKHAQ